jgi:RimJ/RimL family protein N-acetyltransferase
VPAAADVATAVVVGDKVARFVSEKVGVAFCPPFTAIGIQRGGEVIGGVVFNVFEQADVHVSVAGHGWNREFLRCVGQYAFEQLGYERITAISEFPEIVRIAERLGGQVEGCLRNHFGLDRPAFVVGILRDEYRFRYIGGNHRFYAQTA